MTNCVNCGAPPKRGSKECLFCGTGLAEPAARVSHIDFKSALSSMGACDYDTGRKSIASALAKRKTPFTAGQVRALAETFDYDSGRVLLFQSLMPYITNPLGVLECGDVMDYDSSRQDLARLVGSVGETEDPEEEEDNVVFLNPPPSAAAPANPGFPANQVFLMVLASSLFTGFVVLALTTALR